MDKFRNKHKLSEVVKLIEDNIPHAVEVIDFSKKGEFKFGRYVEGVSDEENVVNLYIDVYTEAGEVAAMYMGGHGLDLMTTDEHGTQMTFNIYSDEKDVVTGFSNTFGWIENFEFGLKKV